MPAVPPRVGIVGLGLIGGSVARDLVARGVEVVGYDRDPGQLANLSTEAGGRIRLVESAGAVMEAPLVLIAVPVGEALDVLAALAPRASGAHVVMDVGSTKRDIAEMATQLGIAARFVGCHPLTGDHRSGWEAARSGMFSGATVFLCPSSETAPDALTAATAFWSALGGCVEALTPAEHDDRMALVSHLPHMVSVALALTLQRAGATHAMLGPGGRDVARLAGGSVELWTQIAAQNRQSLTQALSLFETRARELRTAIESSETAAVAALLANAAAWSGE